MDLVTAHADVINATHRGFAFLMANGLVWLIAGVLAHWWSVQRIATLLLFMSIATTPLAFALREWLGFPDYNSANSLNQLALLIALTPALAFPAIITTYGMHPLYLPAVMAALLGGHFLPYSWLYQTPVYVWIGVAVAIIPGTLLLIFKERGFALGPLSVGLLLIAGAFIVY